MHSVKIFWPDKKAIDKALREFVSTLKKRREVIAVYLCGSWAKGNYTAASDVDLLIIVDDSPLPQLDRAAIYLPDRFPVSLDLFVYTKDELKTNAFAQSLLRDGIELQN